MLRIEHTTTVNGPHQQMQMKMTGAKPSEAKLGFVMVHGRGASAESILGLSQEIEAKSSITFVAPQASNHTWYPHSFLVPTEQNQPGLDSGLQAVYNAVSYLNNEGLSTDNIFILGFSQGACLASEFAARHPQKYAGIIALSGGLIGEEVNTGSYSGDLEGTPYFVGCSDVDMHIPEQRVHDSAEVFELLNADVTKKIYPGLAHTINEDELSVVNAMVNNML